MHNEDAVGFTTARRFAPNRPYRVTFNAGVHGSGDNAYCQGQSLTQTMPASSRAATRWARARSEVCRPAVRPPG
ncbi:hypothetical protein GCM10010304_40760 [Streptomyces roseoviolaceus]